MATDLNSNCQEVEGTVHTVACHKGPEVEQRYSSTLSLTSVLDGVGGQCPVPAALPQGKTRCPLHRRLGWSQGQSGQVQKILPSAGI